MTIKEGMLVAPGPGCSLIAGVCRILAIDAVRKILIAIDVSHLVGGKKRKYVRAAFEAPLDTWISAFENGHIGQLQYVPPPHWIMTDSDYLDAAGTGRERKCRIRRLAKRDTSLRLIEDIVDGRSVREVALALGQSAPLMIGLAAEREVNKTTLYRLLSLYLSSGGNRNSLIPETALRGGRGKAREQRRKLGRTSRLEVAEGRSGYALSETDKQRLGLGYRLIDGGLKLKAAYRRTLSAYWSVYENGVHTLLPAAERPTFDQFKRWGAAMNTDVARNARMMRGRKKVKAYIGTTRQQAAAFGQVAEIDSTSTDVHLVSVIDRRKVLPAPSRTILVEPLTGLELGAYIGFESPSTETIFRALLNSLESKRDLCERFDVTYDPDDWIEGIGFCRHLIIDNGEGKSQEFMEAARIFGFSCEFVVAYGADRKGTVESQHRSSHKRLDHDLPGTTKGRVRRRGEPKPADLALWNYSEYMREYILMWIRRGHERVPERANLSMIQAGVEPTRLNIARWLINNGIRADSACDLNYARAFLIPRVLAWMTPKGIRLHDPVNKEAMSWFRYISVDVSTSREYREACEKEAQIAINIRLDRTDLSKIWFVTDTGMHEVPEVDREDWHRDVVLDDAVQYSTDEKLEEARAEHQELQASIEADFRRADVTREAAAEKAALVKVGGRRPKPESMKKSRDHEMGLLGPRRAKKNRTALSSPRAGDVSVALGRDEAVLQPTAQTTYESAMDRVLKKSRGKSQV